LGSADENSVIAPEPDAAVETGWISIGLFYDKAWLLLLTCYCPDSHF